MKKFAILILSSVMLLGCGHLQPKPTEVFRCKTAPNLPDPPAIELQQIEWVTIANDKDKTTVVYRNQKMSMEDFWQLMEDTDQGKSIIGLTGRGYADLSVNVAKIQEWSRQKTIQHEKTIEYYACK